MRPTLPCLSLILTLLLPFALAARAAEPEVCRRVTFSDVGWTDITVTTAMARLVLEQLGYETRVKRLSVPDTYRQMANKDVDVFLGNWMPSQSADSQPYVDDGRVQRLAQPNLVGAKYTLAVNRLAYDGGLHDYADLARFRDQLDGKIYGIEPGNDGNELIKKMIAANAFKLGDFGLVESSEIGMLANVGSADRKGKWIVFLGWEPHPMNTRFDIRYLTGGDDYFGPDFGGADVYTVVRAGYLEQCPNLARLWNNLRFDLDMENHLMDDVLSERTNRRRASLDWLKAHPKLLDAWLDGVTRHDGARPAANLGLW